MDQAVTEDVTKYGVIVVDPPWPVKKLTHKARPNQTTMDYPTMNIDDIRSLDIKSLAKEECWLFLWATQKFLFIAKDILEAWGFHHLVTGSWEKTYGISAGMPLFGFRWNVEFFLVGYLKKPPLWPKRPLIPLAFSAPNVRHSQKPDVFYKMVETLDKDRLDIFARKERDGWHVFGNEVDSDISLIRR